MPTITFEQPLAQPNNLQANAELGGSLDPHTTYYYKVVAVNKSAIADRDILVSPASLEVTATTTDVNLKIALTWDAVSGAVGYYVFRTTISGDYNSSTARFCRASDNSTYCVTVYTNSFTDEGTVTMIKTHILSMLPTGHQLPFNADPITYGTGNLTISGGSSGSPITLQTIYDDAVANGWTDWCKWDGNTFVLLGNFNVPLNSEVHFRQRYGVFYCIGNFTCHSNHASSSIQFGDLTT
jgi:hypothetical protein